MPARPYDHQCQPKSCCDKMCTGSQKEKTTKNVADLGSWASQARLSLGRYCMDSRVSWVSGGSGGFSAEFKRDSVKFNGATNC